VTSFTSCYLFFEVVPASIVAGNVVYLLCSGETLLKNTLVLLGSMLRSTHLAQVLSALLKASSPAISTIFPCLSRWSHLHPDVWGKVLGV